MGRFKKCLIIGMILLIFSIALSVFPCFVSAHPGRTDSAGGHYDRSMGEYHYHHGYPAHQHENGVCKYNFDDQTNSNNNQTNSNNNTGIKKASSNTESNERYKFIIILIFAAGLFVFAVYPRVSKKKTSKIADQINLEKISSITLDSYAEPYGTDIDAYEFVIPEYISFISDMNKPPCVYTSRNGKCYHFSHGCSGATIETGIEKAIARYYPCSKCTKNPNHPVNRYIKQKAMEYKHEKAVEIFSK